jgi:PIN domain nuclease of toxin-antitoxin system
MIHVIDAHPLIWYFAKNPRLGTEARRVLNDLESTLLIPATVLAEVFWIVESRDVGLSPGDIIAALDSDPRLQIVPLDRQVIERSNSLTTIKEMHDRQIVATTILIFERGESVSLITRDQNITESGLVPVIW